MCGNFKQITIVLIVFVVNKNSLRQKAKNVAKRSSYMSDFIKFLDGSFICEVGDKMQSGRTQGILLCLQILVMYRIFNKSTVCAKKSSLTNIRIWPYPQIPRSRIYHLQYRCLHQKKMQIIAGPDPYAVQLISVKHNFSVFSTIIYRRYIILGFCQGGFKRWRRLDSKLSAHRYLRQNYQK